MNNVQMIGRMTKDVELKYTQNGNAVATFTLAVNRPFRNHQGNQDADFIRCQIWRKPAENTAQYCGKGSQVGVTGRIQTRSFEGQDGKTVFMTEVVADNVEFLDTRNQNGQGNQQHGYQPNNQNKQQNNPYQGQGVPVDVNDEDLPF
ncbi:single-stranded DNA-binding protein [Lentibacillus amyloliquefaciens]|uniref:Single-stranded DNA-binding protein n=1 Tax=Lentibacillus amyloliquefaciens TaxID=1472767 RepID=A0A0U4FGD3_9BACI|nr:single-stranded DNA-binding protein [Lentibacillus amyloliquefaciens]ALX47726.1 single-stranded DNA-binding protein [Lentibacillus amyloliquefaciens]